jgi:hypothetical protein
MEFVIFSKKSLRRLSFCKSYIDMAHKWLRTLIKIPMWSMAIIAFLIAIRIALPSIGKWIINRELDRRLGTYVGHISDFDLNLYRGAYQLLGLEIKKRSGTLPPILSMDTIDLSLAWRALLRKEITADIKIKGGIIRLIDSQQKERKQFGTEEKGWRAALDVIFPMSIESLRIRDSSIYFTNYDFHEKLPVKLSKIKLDATDLRIQPSSEKNVNSPFVLNALAQDHALLHAEGRIDALADPPRADTDFYLRHFRLNSINQVLLNYLPLDITRGTLDIYGEAATAEGDLQGYVKVFFKNGDIIASNQKFVSVKHFFYEILSAVGNWFLQNSKNKAVAAYIPFERYDGKLNVNSSKAFWSAVKNMGNKLPEGIDHTINMNSLRHHQGK